MMNTNQLSSFPNVSLKSITEAIQYGYTESSTNEPIGPKFLRITDIQNNTVEWETVPYCKIDDSKLERYKLQTGDLLFARTGATVGKSFLIKGNIPDAVFASYLIRVTAKKEKVYPQFLSYFFQAPNYWTQIIEGQVGIGQPNVNGTKLSELRIPLPPLPIQQAIVARLEALFSELDKGIEQLKTVRQQLRTYRQAVLKAAFEGRLTGEQIKDGELPEGWKIKMLSDVCIKIQDGSHFSPQVQYESRRPGTFMYVTAKNIRTNYMDLQNITYVEQDFHDSIYHRCNPEYGDVLLTKDGVNTGDITINTIHEPISLLSSVCLLKPKKETLNPAYLKYYIQSPTGNKAMIGEMSGTAIKRIILKKIKATEIILPPIDTQQSIVSEIESRLSVADKLEETIAQGLQQAEALRQSILKKAFEGELQF